MKGSIALSLQQMVQEQYGKHHWKNILAKSGLPDDKVIFSHHDIDDAVMMKLFENTSKELNISDEEAADAFGDFWVNNFAPKAYFAFFTRAKSAKDFLMEMNRVHEKITSNIANATPPKFEYEEIDDSTITMTYISNRGLEHLWIGLIKGAAKYFDEKIEIENITKNKVKISFF